MVLYKYNLGLVFFFLSKIVKASLIEVFHDKKKKFKIKKFSKMYELPVLSFAVSIKEIKADWFS